MLSVDQYGEFRKGQKVYLCSYKAVWHGACAEIIGIWPDLIKKIQVKTRAAGVPKELFVKLSNISTEPLDGGTLTDDYDAGNEAKNREEGSRAPRQNKENGAAAGPVKQEGRIVSREQGLELRIGDLEAKNRELQADCERFGALNRSTVAETRELQARLDQSEAISAILRAGNKRKREERNAATQQIEGLADTAAQEKLLRMRAARISAEDLGQVRGDREELRRVVARKELVIGNLRDQVKEAAEHVEKSNFLSGVAIACSVVSTVGACVVALAAGVGL